jgi:sigma-E factor negative regulatory protein RseC
VIRTGRVREISGNTVTLIEEKAGACFGCVKEDCGGSRRLFRAENPRGLPLSPGQAAEAELIPPSLIREALMSLLPPILAFMTGYVLTGLLFPAGGEAPQAAAGVLFLLGTAFLLYRIRRRFPPRTGFRILRVMDTPI